MVVGSIDDILMRLMAVISDSDLMTSVNVLFLYWYGRFCNDWAIYD